MTDVATVIAWTRRLTAALLIASLAGCSHATRALPLSSAAARLPVIMRFGDHVVAAALTDTPPARDLASMLPLTLRLRDAWGQAKTGPLPRALTIEGGTPVHDPAPGGIYFWPGSGVLAVYYDDLGQTVPGPGLIRLGTVAAGLDRLAEAGSDVTVQIESPGVAHSTN